MLKDNNSIKFQRLLSIPENDSFFVFGPRAVGKSWDLREKLKTALRFDLLDTKLCLELAQDPSLLIAKIGKTSTDTIIWIDEVQKVPALLDLVHQLIEEKNYRFALSGSSARKLKRGGANMLASRALTRNMESLTSFEIDQAFDLEYCLEWGQLPKVVKSREDAADILESYFQTYLKEEIREEGIIRKLEPFLRFLPIAGLLNGSVLNSSNIASEARVPRSTVDQYFAILQDTLLIHWLTPYQLKFKTREVCHPKYYWFDIGVARAAAQLLHDPVEQQWLGAALETLIFHELRVYNDTHKKFRPLHFYREHNGLEVDFLIEVKKATANTCAELILLEVKHSKRWRSEYEKGIRTLYQCSKIKIIKSFGVYLGSEKLFFDPIEIWPAKDFLKELFAGNIF